MKPYQVWFIWLVQLKSLVNFCGLITLVRSFYGR